MTATAKRPLLARAAEAAGGIVGAVMAASERRRAADLARTPTGRLDATWTARNSTSRRAYEAGTETRANADWRAGLTAATAAIVESLDVMLARSRWLIRNDGYAASAQAGYRRKVVGGGITARASARHPDTGEMLKGYNTAHDLLWNAWALDPRACDVEQTKCLYEKQALWMDELFAAGGVLLRAVYTPRAEGVGLAVQEIEYEQFNRDLTGYEGRAVYRGVETDAYGAPTAYHVHAAAHPLEQWPTDSLRIPAAECWHLYRKTRVRQRIGAPMTAPVITALRNLAMYELFTINKARTEAAYHGFVLPKDTANATVEQIRKRISAARPSGQTADDPRELQVRVENGLFPVLKDIQDVKFPPSSTPNTVYPPFVTENLKKIAAGVGLDLPTVARWYADGNFNTQRKADLEAQAEVEGIQDLCFINGALRGIRELWTEIAVREGKLKATGFRESARWRAAYLLTNWQGPPRRTVDEIKDQAAWDMKYRSLRGSPMEYFNEHGRDPRDVLSEWQEFLQMARDDYDLGPLLEKFFGTATANAPKAGKQPAGSGGDADPEDASGGGNGDLAETIARRTVLGCVLDDGDGPPSGSAHGGSGRRM